MSEDYKKTISRLSLKSPEMNNPQDENELKVSVTLGWDSVVDIFARLNSDNELDILDLDIVDESLYSQVGTALKEEEDKSLTEFFHDELIKLYAECKVEQKLSVPKEHLRMFLKDLDDKDKDTKYQYASALYVNADGTGKIKTFKTPIETKDSAFVASVKDSVLSQEPNAEKVFLIYYVSQRKLEHKLL